MNDNHYPNANIILNDGDEIHVIYVRKHTYYNAKTLKRLCGWICDKILIGIVKNGKVYFSDETGKNKFVHVIYNIELYLTEKYLKLISIKRCHKQLELF